MDRLRITKPGTVFVIKKDGISGDMSSDSTFLTNKIQDGQVKQAKGILASIQNKKTSRTFNPDQRVYLFKVMVMENDILFYIITCETSGANIAGSTQQIRYKSLLDFQFPKNYLASADFNNIKGEIEAVLEPEKAVKAAEPKKIEIGQSTKEVEEIMGKPEKIINLGPKTVYVYKDMKVVFVNGKLTDVQ